MADIVCSPATTFCGVKSINDDLLLNLAEANLKSYLDWAFLNLGAWFDATINDYNITSPVVQQSQLLPVADEAYTDGQVWQGIRKDWVYETDCHSSAEPINITGLTVDGAPYSYPGGGFTINYPEGRVIFDTPLSISSVVLIEYSYRNVQIYRASDAEWFSELQYSSFNNSNLDIVRTEDGNWSIAGNQRIQLPAIVIDPISRSSSAPREIGSRTLVINQDVGLYVIAETKNERNKLLDILRLQQGTTIQFYNTNLVAQNQAYPLNDYLDKNLSGFNYPDLITNYPSHYCLFKSINLYEIMSLRPNLHQGLARFTLEIIA